LLTIPANDISGQKTAGVKKSTSPKKPPGVKKSAGPKKTAAKKSPSKGGAKGAKKSPPKKSSSKKPATNRSTAKSPSGEEIPDHLLDRRAAYMDALQAAQAIPGRKSDVSAYRRLVAVVDEEIANFLAGYELGEGPKGPAQRNLEDIVAGKIGGGGLREV
jgi:hypothetical protein